MRTILQGESLQHNSGFEERFYMYRCQQC